MSIKSLESHTHAAEKHQCDLVFKSKKSCDCALVDRKKKIKNMSIQENNEEIMFSEQTGESGHLDLDFAAMTSSMRSI